jgi:transposase-like protein/IS1 family transposase
MNCPVCDALSKKDGKDRKGDQRFKCTECGKRFSLPKEKLFGPMILADEKALLCLNLLVEGNSVRSTERITGVHRDTILSLLETVGKKCVWIQESLVKDVKVGFVEADEVWSFVAMKEKTKHSRDIESDKIGSAYTFTCIDADTKLIVAWHLGNRNEEHALTFLRKIREAVDPDTEFQISTDAFRGYNSTVPMILGGQAHYGQVIKTYGATSPDEARYSPAVCTGVKKKKMLGNPIKKNISTSMVERQNLTMRMSMRRFTRLTNGFSKKWDNLNYMLAIYFAYYNFCRSHKTLNDATPAMAANLTKTIWSLKDLLNAAKDVLPPSKN